MRFCRLSAVIMAFTAIELHGAVNVTASREYVDRKVTSVSNSIMDEVSSNLRKVASDIASATNDPTIVRGEKLDAPPDVWGISVSRALTANWAEEADRAGTAESVLSVPWDRVKDTPTSLSGYGITDAVPSSRMVNGKPLASDITLSASDLGAATTDGLAAATTNVVHGDYSDADRAAFPNGLGLKAGDGTDKGYVGLRLRSLESRGLEVVGTRVTSTIAAPYTLFQLTDAGIRFPKEGLGDNVQGSDFTFLYWDAFSRATHVQDSMPSSGTAKYEGYPISGKAFNEYFWGLGDLPAKAKASVTVHAASNLVGTAGAPMGVSDIIGSAVKESVLAVTSDVPVYAYSSAWTSDWPADDSAQPSQPQWADGTWSVYLVEGGQTLPGAYSVEGPEDATTLTIDIAGFPTVFTRESTVSGYVNAHGFARMGDVDSKIASATNGLLRTESDPMFTAWTNGTATLSGSFVQGTGFKNALVNNPILASGARSHAQGYATKAYGDNSHAEGLYTVASNMNSHAEGEYTKALGRGSHAEGSHTVASNDYSHAEGEYTVAGGRLSHAGGSYSRAWGDTSRAWGSGATANAAMSVSEGNQTQANGWYSTARGYWTAANGVMSHAEGVNATAEGNPIFSPEDVSDLSDLVATYAWSAVYKGEDTNSNYRSHRPGTYNLNPVGGAGGFYIGEQTLSEVISGEVANKADKTELEGFATIEDLLAFYYPDGNVTSMSQITTNGIEYAVGEDGGAYVASGNGLSGHVVLPWKVTIGGKSYNVTAIGNEAFDNQGSANNSIGFFTAPITVKNIGDAAFRFCGSIRSINLPSVTSTGAESFLYCHSLVSVNLPSVTVIGEASFVECEKLTTLHLHSATSIGASTFYLCSSLANIDFGSSPKSAVPSLSESSFEGVPTSCKFIIPIGMYADWISASGWSDLYARGYKFEGYASTAQLANKADKATTLAGYGITDAVPLVEDVNSNKTAVTIGGRKEGEPVGAYSFANGTDVTASGESSHAEGSSTTASGDYSHAEGVFSIASNLFSYVWNADALNPNKYGSHGEGTYNLNPAGGLAGLYIGETSLKTFLDAKASTGDVQAAISAVNPTFSNAVLAVGLNIDTDSVAVLNEIASTFGGFPIEGTATTIGGLLAALAAAIAWLRKNKADKATTLAGYGITDAATKTELNALAAKVDAANAALEEVA